MKTTWIRKLKKQWQLQVIVLFGMAMLIIFSHIPLVGIVIAFKNYSVNMGFSGIWTSEWVGLRWFQEFFGFYRFKDIFLNTVILSVLKLIFTFPAPILLAVLISELKSRYFKRVVQTVSYLPNFISWVLLYTIANSFLTTQGGIINSILMNLGIINAPIAFMTSENLFRPLAVFWAVWKNSGYWAIIFQAAISGIDTQLYEAADIDGASRMQKIIHITLPGIRSAAVTVLIMSIGGLMGGRMGGSNFEQAFIFGNPFNNGVSEIMQTYSMKWVWQTADSPMPRRWMWSSQSYP